MNFFKNIFLGILIGSGAILPGISSGVLCIAFGIYEKLLNSVLYFFKNFKKNFKFLLPIVLGISIGVILFANMLNSLFVVYPNESKSIFIGLILGCMPKIFKEVNAKSKFKFHYLIFLFVSFIIGISSIFLKNYISYSFSNLNFVYLLFSGFCMSFGVIIPGISSTVILMLLGIYKDYLYAVSSIYLPILFPLGIGLFCGSLFCLKLTKYLFEKFYCQTFFSIIGFTLGSLFVIFPQFNVGIDIILYIFLILLGFILTV